MLNILNITYSPPESLLQALAGKFNSPSTVSIKYQDFILKERVTVTGIVLQTSGTQDNRIPLANIKKF